MTTLDVINLKIAKLQKQAVAIAEKEMSAGLARIRELMHRHGLSIADIERFVGKNRGGKLAASGGKAAVKAPRAGVRHIEPKYADPKTGATWTGRGRAPAWIRDVRDRSKFLIEAGARSKDVAKKPAPAKKASAKRAPVTKSVKRAVTAKKAPAQRTVSPAGGARARKAAAPAKKASAPRKIVARKTRTAVKAVATPEVVAE
ncbi:MAG: H-NS histone family protein [Paraburkholderia sp.]|uniref:H-NS histone family protein n=1 Tax=Paraburkholderia sp. TaxID=1926495 RepID=UPI001201252F|nr:H-NS histone family protein [Paraburkholderia sp.]TAM08244.1 MAG: H-NS histone family protein [Paraburkholderia sp.]